MRNGFLKVAGGLIFLMFSSVSSIALGFDGNDRALKHSLNSIVDKKSAYYKIVDTFSKDLESSYNIMVKNNHNINGAEYSKIKRMELAIKKVRSSDLDRTAISFSRSYKAHLKLITHNYNNVVVDKLKGYDDKFVSNVRTSMKGVNIDRELSADISNFVINVSRRIRDIEIDKENNSFYDYAKMGMEQANIAYVSGYSEDLKKAGDSFIKEYFSNIDNIVMEEVKSATLDKIDRTIFNL